jgi:hypothetical protein
MWMNVISVMNVVNVKIRNIGKKKKIRWGIHKYNNIKNNNNNNNNQSTQYQ